MSNEVKEEKAASKKTEYTTGEAIVFLSPLLMAGLLGIFIVFKMLGQVGDDVELSQAYTEELEMRIETNEGNDEDLGIFKEEDLGIFKEDDLSIFKEEDLDLFKEEFGRIITQHTDDYHTMNERIYDLKNIIQSYIIEREKEVEFIKDYISRNEKAFQEMPSEVDRTKDKGEYKEENDKEAWDTGREAKENTVDKEESLNDKLEELLKETDEEKLEEELKKLAKDM